MRMWFSERHHHTHKIHIFLMWLRFRFFSLKRKEQYREGTKLSGFQILQIPQMPMVRPHQVLWKVFLCQWYYFNYTNKLSNKDDTANWEKLVFCPGKTPYCIPLGGKNTDSQILLKYCKKEKQKRKERIKQCIEHFYYFSLSFKIQFSHCFFPGKPNKY